MKPRGDAERPLALGVLSDVRELLRDPGTDHNGIGVPGYVEILTDSMGFSTGDVLRVIDESNNKVSWKVAFLDYRGIATLKALTKDKEGALWRWTAQSNAADALALECAVARAKKLAEDRECRLTWLPADPWAAVRAAEAGLQPGVTVTLHSLKSASHWNGASGDIKYWHAKSGRWVVTFPDGKGKFVKPENLVPHAAFYTKAQTRYLAYIDKCSTGANCPRWWKKDNRLYLQERHAAEIEFAARKKTIAAKAKRKAAALKAAVERKAARQGAAASSSILTRPWCYTMDPAKEWEFYEVPECAAAAEYNTGFEAAKEWEFCEVPECTAATEAPKGAKIARTPPREYNTGFEEHKAGRTCADNKGDTWWSIMPSVEYSTFFGKADQCLTCPNGCFGWINKSPL